MAQKSFAFVNSPAKIDELMAGADSKEKKTELLTCS